MKIAVVTGATGFIGEALTKFLLKYGIKVYAIGRNKQKLENIANLGAIPIQIDFSEYSLMNNYIKENVDVVYHCAFAGGFSGESLKQYKLQLENAQYASDAVLSAINMRAKNLFI